MDGRSEKSPTQLYLGGEAREQLVKRRIVRGTNQASEMEKAYEIALAKL